MYVMFVRSGKEKYRASARRLVQYMQGQQLYDGSWLNDEPFDWKGTTLFQTLSLCHAYDYLNRSGHLSETDAIKDMIEKSAQWTSWAFGERNIRSTNMNYWMTSAAVLEWCFKITGQALYSEQARSLIQYALSHINHDGFIIGELDGTGLRSLDNIDIGYNMDMSLAALAEYAELTGDARVRSEAVRAMGAHVNFIYPDGSMDNSFGSRSYKWTLFGSKTAHGCQMALMMLADQDSRFAQAAEDNADYLITRCMMEDGFIGNGPRHAELFREPCIHPLINRADAWATALIYGKAPAAHASHAAAKPSSMQCYPSLRTCHVRSGPWAATITTYGAHNSATGGAISYLWHQKRGPVQLASATEYSRNELINMPEFPVPYKGPVTPRIEGRRGQNYFSSLYEYDGCLQELHIDRPEATVSGKLKSGDGFGQLDSHIAYTIHYRFTEHGIEKHYRFLVQFAVNTLSVIEPLVLLPDTEVTIAGDGLVLNDQSGVVRMRGEEGIFRMDDVHPDERNSSIFPAVICFPAHWKAVDLAPGIYEFKLSIFIE
jgi:hypothetical protein